MSENTPSRENDLVDDAVIWLRGRLPESWTVERSNRQELKADNGSDGGIDLRSNNGMTGLLLVQARRSFSPRDTDRLLAGMTRQYQKLYGYNPIMVVAPWIGLQAQQRLRENGVAYIDLTGNAWITMENPAVFIESQGSRRNPNSQPTPRSRVQGPKAGRLLRWLIDVCPPYGVRDLASAAVLSQGYVSRVLEALDEDALIERDRKGKVEATDVVGLMRRWTGTYSLLKANTVTRYIARSGAETARDNLSNVQLRTAITGSFAAVRRAPVAAPTLLAVYTDAPGELAQALDLLPADQGVNVILLSPYDPVVWDRTETTDGLRYVADSQAAADCLTGTGRMPAEGEALMDWMVANESAWRLESISATGRS